MTTDISTNKTKTLTFFSFYYLKQKEFEANVAEVLKSANISDFDQVSNRLIVFDLSKSYWHDLGTLLWLITLLYKLKRQGNELELIFPDTEDQKGTNLWDFLIRWHFFDALADCVDEPANMLKPHQVPIMMKGSRYAIPLGRDEYDQQTVLHTLKILEITTLRPGAQVSKYDDKVIVSALSQKCGWDNLLTKMFMQRVVREGVANSALHSGGSFSNIAMRLDSKNLTLAISDDGIGIPEVLRKSFKQRGSDADLIQYFTDPNMILDSRLIKLSTEKGITSSPERKGLGLYYLKSLVLSQGGELRIRSGRACVDFTASKVDPYDNMLSSPGTMIRVQTPLKS